MKKEVFVWMSFLLCLAACGGNRQTEAPKAANGEYVYLVADSLLTEEERALKMVYIHRVPDYLLTEEQEKLKRKRLQVLQDEVLSKYLKMDEEGRLEFSMSREDFLKTSFPEPVYWSIRERVERQHRLLADSLPALRQKVEVAKELLAAGDRSGAMEDTARLAQYSNRDKVIPAWVREEVSEEEYGIIEQLNERYGLWFSRWEEPMASLVERVPAAKNRATLDFLLHLQEAEDALVIPSVEEMGKEEGVVHYRLTAVVWRAVYGQAEVHLDVEVDYGYDEQTRQFVELDACKLKPVFDAEDLVLTWHDRVSMGDLREDGTGYKVLICGYVRAEVDLGERLHLDVRVKDFYDRFHIPLQLK